MIPFYSKSLGIVATYYRTQKTIKIKKKRDNLGDLRKDESCLKSN
jgi:hypothetical protein